eukprot:gene28412-31553_t
MLLADEFDLYFYRPPNPQLPTRCLYLGNCSSLALTDIEATTKNISADAQIVLPTPTEPCQFLYVLFPDAEIAERAARALTVLWEERAGSEPGAAVKGPPAQSAVHLDSTPEKPLVPGLLLLKDFISEEEEVALSQAMSAAPWVTLSKRRVQHHGYAFDYCSRSFGSKLGPHPEFVLPVTERCEALLSSTSPECTQKLDQLTVNEYEPGVGLASHVDTHSAFTGSILSLSLGSQTVMEFRRGDEHRALLLPARSLLVMAGESRSLLVIAGENRYAWQHYIPHRKADLLPIEGGSGSELMPRGKRLSMTLRTVRGFACDCQYPAECDSQASQLPPTRISLVQQQREQEEEEARGKLRQQGEGHGDLEGNVSEHGSGTVQEPERGCSASHEEEEDESALQQLENDHVVAVYDAIAQHFSATRFAIWPKVKEFIHAIPSGGVVADVGCGNGKYFGVRKDLAVLGSDRSPGLADVAARRLHPLGLPPSESPKADVLVADALALPYRPGSCDAVLCIAVLHHISSRTRRIRLLNQLLNVLRKGGRAIVTVWASEQEDPKRTVNKWLKIGRPEDVLKGGSAQQGVQEEGKGGPEVPSTPEDDLAEQLIRLGKADSPRTASTAAPPSAEGTTPSSSAQEASEQLDVAEAPPSVGGGQGQVQGPDYFVPWHLPFHRVAAGGAIRNATVGTANTPAPKVDNEKSAVVYKRYYHLFDAGELDELVVSMGAEVKLVDSFYDHSNWEYPFDPRVLDP